MGEKDTAKQIKEQLEKLEALKKALEDLGRPIPETLTEDIDNLKTDHIIALEDKLERLLYTPQEYRTSLQKREEEAEKKVLKNAD